MGGPSGNIAAVAGAIRLRLAVEDERHFPAQDHMRGFFGVLVIWIERIWTVLPYVGAAKAFVLQACRPATTAFSSSFASMSIGYYGANFGFLTAV